MSMMKFFSNFVHSVGPTLPVKVEAGAAKRPALAFGGYGGSIRVRVFNHPRRASWYGDRVGS